MKEKDDDKHEPFKSEGEETYAFKPDTKTYVRVNDVREKMEQECKGNAPTKEQRQAFYQQRIRLIEATGSPYDHKKELLQDLIQSAQEEEKTEDPDSAPLPGGVGYGAYYKDGALKFANSTVLHYYIVTVPEIGDAKNNWLYLTSTNRSPRGVEAFVSFHKQDGPTFTIFDWSKTGEQRWALSVPYDKLGNYLIKKEVEGKEYQPINVANSTRRMAGTMWRNEVMLYNQNTQNYDLVYRNDYNLPVNDEGKYLWWGPIVETFAPFPYSTKVIGFFDAQLLQDDNAPRLLTSDLTDLKEQYADHPGFKIAFAKSNYSFVVSWTA